MAAYFGLYRGLVVGQLDPTNGGRVQISLPTLDMGGPRWAAVCAPIGNSGRAPAQVGAEVWVMFEAGQLDRPVVMGLARS
jgi:Type VI secretion system/phage-baseplate injector OB domain